MSPDYLTISLRLFIELDLSKMGGSEYEEVSKPSPYQNVTF